MQLNLSYSLHELDAGASRRRLGRRWVASSLALWATSLVLGGFEVRGLLALLLSAGLLTLLQAYVRPVAFLLTLPLTLITLGFFTLALNGLLLLLVGALVPGVTVAGFWAAIWGALWVSLFAWLAGWLLQGR